MKTESNFETAFKFFAICYLDKSENFDLRLLRGLEIFRDQKNIQVDCERLLAVLAKEIGRRRDSLDLSKFKIPSDYNHGLKISALDLKTGGDDQTVKNLRDAMSRLEKDENWTPGKRKRVCEGLRTAVSKFGICI